MVVLIGIHFPSIYIYIYIITQTMNDEIDEVESLTAARAGAMAGTEPSDGLRVCCRTLQPFFFVHTIIQGRKCSLNTVGQAQAAEKCFNYGHQ